MSLGAVPASRWNVLGVLCAPVPGRGAPGSKLRAVLTDLSAQKLARKADNMELVCLAILSTASLVSGLQVKGRLLENG